jgi:sialate O-acetylesterase
MKGAGLAARICLALIGAPLIAGAQASPASTSLRLPRLFADGMVLQRDARIPVWGWAAPGTNVAVTLGERSERATTDMRGQWTVQFPAMKAGGPIQMSVEAPGTRLNVHDILVGDVWVGSGQSNMEFTVSIAKNAAQEIAAAKDLKIRQFKVPNSWAETAAEELEGGSWAPADSQHVGEFSAVAYFFARELRKSVDVPIGIINSSWGGSNIETWLSREAHGLTDSAWNEIAKREHAHAESIRDRLMTRIGTLPTVDAGLVNGRAIWADSALADDQWATIRVPSFWEHEGYDGFDGVAWYRLSFTLSASEAATGGRLSLGAIDDDDITWVNGVEIGRTAGYMPPRVYTLPPSALRAGRNVLAVQVTDGQGGGGIYSDSSLVYLEIGGVRRPLAGAWKFKVGKVALQPDGQYINKIPTVLYNAMLHPLLRFPIKGVLWYQGESNANDYEQAIRYRPLFLKLITSWRREWSGTRGDFPFLWVQLPNYNPSDSTPPIHSAWATQRESMVGALGLPNTGQAITIDLGGAADLHPTNKQDVGLRLALVARRVVYGQRVVSSGPTYRKYAVQGSRVSIEFDNVSGGLVSRERDGSVSGFAIAGADHRFVWAQARIEGDRVVVWSDRVPKPVAVRYAWADNPPASLYNRDGLPAAPFRTDAW